MHLFSVRKEITGLVDRISRKLHCDPIKKIHPWPLHGTLANCDEGTIVLSLSKAGPEGPLFGNTPII